MNKILLYLKPIIEDNNEQPSRKRIIELLCAITGCTLTVIVTIEKIRKPELDVATLTMLIAPLFATALAYSGITGYFQNKKDEINESNKS